MRTEDTSSKMCIIEIKITSNFSKCSQPHLNFVQKRNLEKIEVLTETSMVQILTNVI